MKKINLFYAVGIPTLFALLMIFGFICNGVLQLNLSGEVLASILIIGVLGLMLSPIVHGLIYKITMKKMDKQLETMQINQVFNGSSSRIAIDQTNNKMVLTFAYNPGQIYTLPLSSITKAYTKDYKSGSGIFEGTMQVAFLFEVDGQRVKINTLTAHRQKMSMNSHEVLTAIVKADAMVEVLTAHLVKEY